MSKSIKENLMKIIINDNLDEFKLVSKSLQSINEAINEKSLDNSLHLCPIFNSIKIFEYLMTDCIQQIDVNLKNKEGKTALHLSAQYKRLKCCQLLLKTRKTIIDPLNRSDWSPLMLALTKENNFQVIELLIEHKASLSLKNKDGWNCFHIAVRTGDLAQIELLTHYCDKQQGHNVCANLTKNRRSPFHTAVSHGLYSVVELLLEDPHYLIRGDSADSCGITPFVEALRNNDIKMCRLLMQKQKYTRGPFSSDALGKTSLHASAECNAIDSIKYLVNEFNFPINCVTTVGFLTPLHYAVKEGHKQTIQLLLDLGADMHQKDYKERSPYELAILLKRHDCEQIFRDFKKCN